MLQQGAAEQRTGAGLGHAGGQCAHAPQVHRLDAVGQLEAGTLLAVAQAVDRGVHGDHQAAVARSFGAPHQLAGEVAVRLDVELEPEGRLGGPGDGFEADAGLGADHQGSAHGRGAQGAGQFAVRVGQALEGHRGEQDGVIQRQVAKLHAGVAAAQVFQHPVEQAHAAEGGEVVSQGPLVRRAAAEVGPGGGAHALTGEGLVVADGDDLGGNPRQRRQAHGAFLRSQVVDQCRNRLW